MYQPRLIIFLCGWIAFIAAAHCQADLVWQSAGFADEQSIANGTLLPGTGFSVTVGTVAFSDSDGGTFDLGAGASASFFSYEGGVLGNEAGHLEMTFNNQNNDPADFLQLTLTFSNAITNLQFSLLDMDRGPGNNNVDAVEVFYNGINVRTNPAFFSLGSAVALDDESYMDGFEGIAAAAANSTAGNIAFNFGSEFINTLTIRYFSSDDANNNPQDQSIGLGDLTFIAVPEPNTWAACLMLIPAIAALRRRRN